LNPHAIEQLVTTWLTQQLSGTNFVTMINPVTDQIQLLAQRLQAAIAMIPLAGRPVIGPPVLPQQPQRSAQQGSNTNDRGFIENLIRASLGSLLTRLAAIFAPLIAFSTLLNQSTSGLQLFVGAINILAATLAPVIMPAFVLLSAALLAVSAILMDDMSPAMEQFYEWVGDKAVPALMEFADWIAKNVTALGQFFDSLDSSPEKFQPWEDRLIKQIDDTIDSFKGLGDAIDWLIRNSTGLINPNVGKAFAGPGAGPAGPVNPDQFKPNAHWEGGGEAGGGDFGGKVQPPGGNEAARFRKEFLQGLKDTVREFERKNLPQAQLTGLVQASRQAQMAALNMSPFEQRNLQILQRVDQWLQRLVNSAEKQINPVVGP
jgi:hypothetical protein